MRCFILTLVVGTTMAVAMPALAGHHAHSYPKVSTFSGGYYGPTQANWQYQHRYGHPWHGQGGLRGYGVGYVNGYPGTGYSGYGSFGSWRYPLLGGYGFGGLYGLGGYGYSSYYNNTSLFGLGYGSLGYGGWGYGVPGYYGAPLTTYPLGLPLVQPTISLQSPGVYTPFWSNNPLVNSALLNTGNLWQQQVPNVLMPQSSTLVEPLGDSPLLPAPSSPEAQLRGLQLQQQGDEKLKQLDYLQAYLKYQESIAAAADRAEPHYRIGIALAGMKKFDKAVRELKLATDIDPDWMNTVTLPELLGPNNLIGKTQLKQRVADWTLVDAHDADRLYLLGALLYLDGNVDKARILLDTAVALVGDDPHLTAFLAPQATDKVAPGHPADEVAPAPAETPPKQKVPADPQPPNPAPPVLPQLPNQTSPSLRTRSGPVFPSKF